MGPPFGRNASGDFTPGGVPDASAGRRDGRGRSTRSSRASRSKRIRRAGLRSHPIGAAPGTDPGGGPFRGTANSGAGAPELRDEPSGARADERDAQRPQTRLSRGVPRARPGTARDCPALPRAIRAPRARSRGPTRPACPRSPRPRRGISHRSAPAHERDGEERMGKRAGTAGRSPARSPADGPPTPRATNQTRSSKTPAATGACRARCRCRGRADSAAASRVREVEVHDGVERAVRSPPGTDAPRQRPAVRERRVVVAGEERLGEPAARVERRPSGAWSGDLARPEDEPDRGGVARRDSRARAPPRHEGRPDWRPLSPIWSVPGRTTTGPLRPRRDKPSGRLSRVLSATGRTAVGGPARPRRLARPQAGCGRPSARRERPRARGASLRDEQPRPPVRSRGRAEATRPRGRAVRSSSDERKAAERLRAGPASMPRDLSGTGARELASLLRVPPPDGNEGRHARTGGALAADSCRPARSAAEAALGGEELLVRERDAARRAPGRRVSTRAPSLVRCGDVAAGPRPRSKSTIVM